MVLKPNRLSCKVECSTTTGVVSLEVFRHFGILRAIASMAIFTHGGLEFVVGSLQAADSGDDGKEILLGVGSDLLVNVFEPCRC